MSRPADRHPLDRLEDVADLVARDRRWVVRGPEVVLRLDLAEGGHVEISPRGPDRYDVLLVDQDTSDLERLLVTFTARTDRVLRAPTTARPDAD